MKRFLEIARREYLLLTLGQGSMVAWETNDENSIQSSPMIMKSGAKDLHSLALEITPGLNALLLHSMTMPKDNADSLTIHLACVIESLRALGVNFDGQTDALSQMSIARLMHQAPGA